jgi:DNA-binding response OmpR family regulator
MVSPEPVEGDAEGIRAARLPRAQSQPRHDASRHSQAIWGANAVDQPEHLWVLVAQLRKTIEIDPAAPRYLVSEPWVGYRLSTDRGAE